MTTFTKYYFDGELTHECLLVWACDWRKYCFGIKYTILFLKYWYKHNLFPFRILAHAQLMDAKLRLNNFQHWQISASEQFRIETEITSFCFSSQYHYQSLGERDSGKINIKFIEAATLQHEIWKQWLFLLIQSLSTSLFHTTMAKAKYFYKISDSNCISVFIPLNFKLKPTKPSFLTLICFYFINCKRSPWHLISLGSPQLGPDWHRTHSRL